MRIELLVQHLTPLFSNAQSVFIRQLLPLILPEISTEAASKTNICDLSDNLVSFSRDLGLFC